MYLQFHWHLQFHWQQVRREHQLAGLLVPEPSERDATTGAAKLAGLLLHVLRAVQQHDPHLDVRHDGTCQLRAGCVHQRGRRHVCPRQGREGAVPLSQPLPGAWTGLSVCLSVCVSLCVFVCLCVCLCVCVCEAF